MTGPRFRQILGRIDMSAMGTETKLIHPRPLDLAFLTAVLLLGYGRVLNSYFLADDFGLIHQAVDVNGDPAWGLVVKHLSSGQALESLRPVVTFLDVLGYALWGVRPAGYHLMNLLFHLANAAFLYTLVASLIPSRSRILPLTAAGLFVTHPIHPEAVTYIGSIPVLACAMFYLLALTTFLRSPARWSAWRGVSVIAFVLALASKEEAVSLPLAVALFGWAVSSASGWRRVRDALIASTPYAVVLAAYFGYRRYLFGHLTPSYVGDLTPAPAATARGVGSLLQALALPVNYEHIGSLAAPVTIALLTISGVALLVCFVWQKPPLRVLAFCLCTILIAATPVHSFLVFLTDPGLRNSRFAYLPSLGLAAGLAVVATWRSASQRFWWPYSVVPTLLIALNLGLLVLNNDAWYQAGALMRHLQAETVRLTGNNPHVELVNVPDTVDGVLFDRGGFQNALFSPFAASTTLHTRHRLVTISGRGAADVHVDAPSGDGDLTWELDAGGKSADTGTRTLVITFQPRAPRAYSTTARLTSAVCDGATATVPIQGRGLDAPPFPTYIVAAIRAVPWPSTDGTRVYVAAVADAKDGIAADDVEFFLEPGVPWRLRYVAIGQEEKKGVPVRIPDGGAMHFRLELTPIGAVRGQAIAFRVAGRNTPIVPAIPGETVLPLPSGDRSQGDYAPGDLAAPDREEDLGQCPALNISPMAVKLGTLPTRPYPIDFNHPISFFGEEPELLFWHDLDRRMLPFSQVAAAPRLLTVSGADISGWERTSRLGYLQVSPTIAAMHAAAPGQSLSKGGLSLSTAESAYFLVRMRLSGAEIPYARLWWRPHSGIFSEANAASVVTRPDGYWHTYAIPLHAQAAWRSLGSVEGLRFQPALSGGWFEIAWMMVIGAIP